MIQNEIGYIANTRANEIGGTVLRYFGTDAHVDAYYEKGDLGLFLHIPFIHDYLRHDDLPASKVFSNGRMLIALLNNIIDLWEQINGGNEKLFLHSSNYSTFCFMNAWLGSLNQPEEVRNTLMTDIEYFESDESQDVKVTFALNIPRIRAVRDKLPPESEYFVRLAKTGYCFVNKE